MDQIKIQQASIDELPTLLEFEQAIVEYERPFEKNMQTEKFNYYDLEALILSDKAEVLVAKSDDKLVGSGYAKIRKSEHYIKNKYHAFFGFMYVDPDYRGLGINKLIVEKLIAWSKAQNMKSISLTVYNENESAIKAYEKTGFNKHLIEMRLDISQ